MLTNSDIQGDMQPTDIGDAGSYSTTRRNMLDIGNSLYGTGVSMDIEIPMIAVIGSQSTGKSSLLENICGITLPRASGTCTRSMPHRMSLSRSSDPWVCTVSLRLLTDRQGQAITVRTIRFGDPISNPEDVAERIKRAQRAILNPSTEASSFLTGEGDETTSEITGPDVVDLSFVDLPGLIASAGSGSTTADIDLVKGLVTEYAKNESCIILLTVTCETEFENQGAYQLARTFDPAGKRTIGVLTKPDRAPRGDEERWVTLLKNEYPQLALDNGWFSVKQPDSVQLSEGITRADARQEERHFFASTKPWDLLPQLFQRRLGTLNLAERCSDVLSGLIAKRYVRAFVDCAQDDQATSRLPEIQKTIQEMLRTTESQLGELPKEPSKDPVGEVYNLVSKFSSALTQYVEGTPGADGLLQIIRPKQQEFKDAIQKTAPDFRPFEKPDADDMQLANLTPPDFLSNEEVPSLPEDDVGAIYIDEVMNLAVQAITRELPDNIPFVVTEMFIHQVVARWETPAMQLFDYVEEILNKKIADFVHAECNQYPHLEFTISIVIADYIADRARATRECLQWLVALEGRPRTLNDHYFRDYRDKFLAWYRGHRSQYNNVPLLHKLKKHNTSNGSSEFDENVRAIMAAFSALDIHDIEPTDLAKVLPTDPYEAAIGIMASVRAYFQVAYKRFADNVPNAIDHELVLGLNRGKALDAVLRKELGVSGPDGYRLCAEYLREDGNVAARREELRNKRERLNKARKELMRLRK
ncbi:P-loop containing nucleoside triphosphate hydrolase protein [Fomitopsis serialis]|uniref:P-loop containing nucleoside triphosphate hydrolase protein n=1 Tax=Fomitopsis serialis TaxID=139415 RepID=UPI002008507D|nr:P-loop containing nucleoside triphosphate hydrolase protein [Neoantrodia serialis]KAH9924573.1 P-loop containing nucleoside triphosphate hydrolase protein [Neoantrodia serialis]